MQPKQTLLQAFKNAFHGIKFVITTQRNAQIHLAITILVITAGLIFSVSQSEWIALVFAIGFVWASESVNTAIEKLTDLASPGYHTLAKYAKDCAAAAVLISALTAVVIGALIFIPYLLHFFNIG
jgi:diacylglycerol kinase